MEIVKRESIGSRGTKRKETPIVETKSNDDLDYAFASPCFARIVVEITFDYHTHTHTQARVCSNEYQTFDKQQSRAFHSRGCEGEIS